MAKLGRPPVGEKAKRDVIAVRATEEFRAKIDAAASASGRSMSQEIELRLEKSFWMDAELGGPRNARVLKVLANAVQSIEEERGGSWLDDPEIAAEVLAAAARILRAFSSLLEGSETERRATERGSRRAAAMINNVELLKKKKVHGSDGQG